MPRLQPKDNGGVFPSEKQAARRTTQGSDEKAGEAEKRNPRLKHMFLNRKIKKAKCFQNSKSNTGKIPARFRGAGPRSWEERSHGETGEQQGKKGREEGMPEEKE